jgi:hypothetical protein
MSKFAEKRWELIYGVQKGIEDLFQYTSFVDKEELQMLLDSLNKMKVLKDQISNQEKDLKLRLLVSSRERNVYLEKLRKIEEFGESKNWKDDSNVELFSKLSDLLYNDNPQQTSSNAKK